MIDGASNLSDPRVVANQDSPQYRRELRKAAAAFEGIMVAKMLEAMRRAVPDSDLFGGKFERGIYEDMLGAEIAKVSARTQGLGVGELLYRSFVEEVVEPLRDPLSAIQRTDSEEVGK